MIGVAPLEGETPIGSVAPSGVWAITVKLPSPPSSPLDASTSTAPASESAGAVAAASWPVVVGPWLAMVGSTPESPVHSPASLDA